MASWKDLTPEQQAQVLRNRNMAQKVRQQSLRNQGLVDAKSPQQFQQNLQNSVPSFMQPGNVGEINNVIWPFYFTFTAPELAPNTASTGFTTITQEASFILVSITKAVFVKTEGPTQYTYIDPNANTAIGDTDGLKFTLRDAQSSRVFQNIPQELDMIGHPEFPTALPSPLFFLPNSTIEITYQNDNPSVTYVPFVTLFGYRLRLNDPSILSTITG